MSVDGVDTNNSGFGVRGSSFTFASGRGVIGRTIDGIGVEGSSRNWFGIYGRSQHSNGVIGQSTDLSGVLGASYYRAGVEGRSNFDPGVFGISDNYHGVMGTTPRTSTRPNIAGVYGLSEFHRGVFGESVQGTGVIGTSEFGIGVHGRAIQGPGVFGEGMGSIGVYGVGNSASGVFGISDRIGVEGRGLTGVFGNSQNGPGVHGASDGGNGVVGRSNSGNGVRGDVNSGRGVVGRSFSGNGVVGIADRSGHGLYGRSNTGFAAFLQGNVKITGNLETSGGSFKIDHPFDPANKYLSHSFVESPDMKNIYDGVVVLDNKGEAEIQLPDWFDVLNKDFRYQLTAIGAPGPNLYIAEEISDAGTPNYNSNKSKFRIAGGISGMKVSWQVTGIRNDPWANANRIQVEEDKPAKEQGYFMYPNLYGQPEEKSISRVLFPEEEKW